ncbi:ribosomal protein S18 acetylase RimI-like enzyme [Agromyces flavus]|uniref:Acetyltransferase (GNAT) family protein n=1 Tax=Agromyces flavus TaxID=589382 RepID=A0A1H1L765_9MICO|nr:GNAT family N-acetyltransferase [Agromyces flavus]MCP2367456.1 ribosomal protein S18 acetylase RimI-like enzyme [Agromyces flavus]GGI45695.1 N-acetyltransferase [Agromyces flavus]SDR70346.1 Acetyltransferase (GNAT) family protein [Agromyces flavus]
MTDASTAPSTATDPRHPSLAFCRPVVSDHARVVAVIPEWWGLPGTADLGRLLPRLFFQHFADTSTIVEDDRGELAGFLIGFRSQSQPEAAYIHFVGVRPDLRQSGLARTLYERFFNAMRASGCRRVDAITGPVNRRSQEFHRAMGFELTGDTEIDGVLAWRDYDGPGEHRVAFTRAL